MMEIEKDIKTVQNIVPPIRSSYICQIQLLNLTPASHSIT